MNVAQAIQQEIQEKVEFSMQAGFHKEQMKRVKNMLGSKCLYLSHEQRSFKKGVGKGQFYFLKAVMKNNRGGKDTVHFEIDGHPRTLTSSDYNNLYTQLSESSYGGKTGV